MTEREKFEKWLNTLDKQTLVAMAAKQARIIEELQAATKAAVPEGWRLVPVEPTEDMIKKAQIEFFRNHPYENFDDWTIAGYKTMLTAAPEVK